VIGAVTDARMSVTVPRLAAGSRLRIVVLGYVVRGPLGGMVWLNLQYLIGLARLGHDVYFLEDSDDYPSCYDPSRFTTDCDPSYGLRFAADTLERIGFAERWTYHDAHTGRWMGPCADRALQICASADLLLDLAGVNPLRPWTASIPVRALVDHDPAFTQVRHLTDPAAGERAWQHTAFFSIGENIGRAGCTVPDDGLPWRPTRPPVVLDLWPSLPGREHGWFTTVMQWDSYVSRECAGRRFGMKSESFEAYVDLPERTSARLELAVGGGAAPRARLEGRGWKVVDPSDLSRDPWTYQEYIQGSKAEFSIAKHGYVTSHCGWFSERSACYLSTGLPVVVQDTGFSDWLPAGEGVVSFTTPDEAIAGLERIERSYARHCRAAREIAAEYFDSRTVLPRLLDDIMSASPAPDVVHGRSAAAL
jgi:hypothetical protein